MDFIHEYYYEEEFWLLTIIIVIKMYNNGKVINPVI